VDPNECGAAGRVDLLPLHRDARVTATDDPEIRRQLARLGVRFGSIVRAVQRTSGGGRVLACGDLRIAIDVATARQIHVVLDAHHDESA
jgi:hypothetical protein